MQLLVTNFYAWFCVSTFDEQIKFSYSWVRNWAYVFWGCLIIVSNYPSNSHIHTRSFIKIALCWIRENYKFAYKINSHKVIKNDDHEIVLFSSRVHILKYLNSSCFFCHHIYKSTTQVSNIRYYSMLLLLMNRSPLFSHHQSIYRVYCQFYSNFLFNYIAINIKQIQQV